MEGDGGDGGDGGDDGWEGGAQRRVEGVVMVAMVVMMVVVMVVVMVVGFSRRCKEAQAQTRAIILLAIITILARLKPCSWQLRS